MAGFKTALAQCLSAVQDVLFPATCAGCRRHVSQPGALCAACWPKLRFLEKPWCAVMGTPFPYDMGEGFLSAEAIACPPPFDRVRSAVVYEGLAGRMVQALKYSDRTDLGPWMARWMLRAGAEFLPDADLILPVPLHRLRFWTRRFNQSAELARPLAKLARIPFEPLGVERVRHTRRQVGLKPEERQRNVRAAFRVPPAMKDKIAGKRVVVVDDVYTTGATVGAVARILKRAGAAEVSVLTFARVLPHDLGEGGFLPSEAELI